MREDEGNKDQVMGKTCELEDICMYGNERVTREGEVKDTGERQNNYASQISACDNRR